MQLPQLPATKESPNTSFRALIPLLIFLAGMAVFWPGLSGDFIYDDHVDIRNVDPVFTPGAWPQLFTTASAQLFRPVKYLSYYIDNQLFGWKPQGWHWQSLLWHAVNGVLLIYLARRLGASLVAAGLGALWFAIHPIHTEAVVWISSRASLQSTTAILLMLLGYDRWRASGARSDLALVLTGGFIGFFSKEDALMIFPILAAYEWYLHRKSLPSLVADKSKWTLFLPLAALAGIYVVMRQMILSGLTQGGRLGGLAGWATSQPVIVVTYLRQMIWPDPMCIDQPVDYAAGMGPAFWGAAIVLAGLVGLLFSRKASFGRWQFAVAFFLISLVPVLGIIPINQARADRFIYLPSVAAALGLAWVCDDLFTRPRLKTATLAVLAVTFSWFGWRSWDYSKTFLNERVLWQTVLAVNPNSYRAWANTAAFQNNSGHSEEALRTIERSLQVRPDYPEGWVIKAFALSATGQLAEAEKFYRQALERVPGEARWLLLLADLLERQQRDAEAEQIYDRIASVRPGYVDARLAAGVHAASHKNFEKARTHWEAVLQFDPKNETARHNLVVLSRSRSKPATNGPITQ